MNADGDGTGVEYVRECIESSLFGSIRIMRHCACYMQVPSANRNFFPATLSLR